MLGLGDGESVGEGGEWETEEVRGGRLREVAGRGRGDGAMKAGVAEETLALVSWSVMMKNLDIFLGLGHAEGELKDAVGCLALRGF